MKLEYIQLLLWAAFTIMHHETKSEENKKAYDNYGIIFGLAFIVGIVAETVKGYVD